MTKLIFASRKSAKAPKNCKDEMFLYSHMQTEAEVCKKGVSLVAAEHVVTARKGPPAPLSAVCGRE
jgi:hypothetical protein